jgi:hypothetical protein
MRTLLSFCYTCLLVAALCCTGCVAIPVSQHPLSDDTNSEIDPDLFGVWDIIDESQEEAAAPTVQKEPAATEEADQPAADPERPPRIGIGRASGKEKTLEVVSMQLTDDHIQIRRFPIHATKVGKSRMLSVRANEEEKESDYFLLRYEVVNENRILVYFLNRETIAQSIQRGELKGVVRKAAPQDPNDPNSEERKELIRITASPAELRDYLIKHEKTAFEPKAFWRLQRARAN